MTVTVTPETFSMVVFDHATILGIAEDLVAQIGLTADVVIDIDERVPLGRVELTGLDPVHLELEGGAIEDPKRIRHLSEHEATDVIGRLLWEAHDRLDPAFGAPELGAELSLAHRNMWETYCIGRLAAAGHDGQAPRRRYAFRNRHGFTDEADAAFDRVWAAEGLTYSALCELSDAAVAVRDGVSP